MRRSSEPTEWVALEASTADDHNDVDFVVFQLTEHLHEKLVGWVKLANMAKASDADLVKLCFFGQPEKWVLSHDWDDEEVEDLKRWFHRNEGKKNWCYLELTLDELNELPEVDGGMDVEQVLVYPDGDCFFSANGQYASETIFTSRGFSVDQFVWPHHAQKREQAKKVLKEFTKKK